MFNKDTDFPQYRKLSNNKVFYRISNDKYFDEIQLIGSRAQLYRIVANQYPEILRIQDMLGCVDDGFEISSDLEFDALLAKYELKWLRYSGL